MSAISYAIDRITREIPKEILELAFLRKASYFGVNTTLAAQITDLVIKKIVLRDTNLIGGINITIPVDKCKQTYYEKNRTNHNLVITVPYTLTNNKKIIEPLSLTANAVMDSNYNGTNNMMVNHMYNILDHRSKVGEEFVTSNLELIAPNTILVYEHITVLANAFLSVIVENNDNLSNLQPRSYLAFGELCVLAAKMFIYNKLIIDLDKGALYGGHELSKIADIVSSYESAFEDYDTFLKEVWSKITFMTDSVSYSKYIQSMVGYNMS